MVAAGGVIALSKNIPPLVDFEGRSIKVLIRTLTCAGGIEMEMNDMAQWIC